MVEEQVNDDSSHYEISLTPTQAFIAFVLLLLSLAASFAFGIIIGKGQVDERLVVRREPTVVAEGNTAAPVRSRIVELGVPEQTSTVTASDTAAATDTAPPDASTPPSQEQGEASASSEGQSNAAPASQSAAAVPFYAQLLSSSDAKAAESLAAKLIENGFTSAYVERSKTEHGMIYRVRVKFPSEAEARAAVDKLKPYTTGEIWVTRQ